MLTLILATSLGALILVQHEGSGGGGIGRLFTNLGNPTAASSAGPFVLNDTPFLDPAKTMQVHEKGLRPTAKATEEDPLLFRHRYQHHDGASNRLLYYQYETKRHPHVVVLDDIGVRSCEAASPDDQPNITTITIVVKDQAGAGSLTSGTVVVGHELGCVARAPNGTAWPWRSNLRERIVGPVPAPLRLADGVSVTFMTVPVALNEVYEHAQLEFYHGHPDKLETTRTKRLESLASNGHEDEGARYNFASTALVRSDATAVAVARRRRLKEPALVKQPATGARNASEGRRLNHPCNSWLYVWEVQDWDVHLSFIGEDCNDVGAATYANSLERIDHPDCYWKTGSTPALKVGNQYRLEWSSRDDDISSQATVEISIGETDQFDNDHCLVLTHGVAFSDNAYEFTMPNLHDLDCAVDGRGTSFPEYHFKIQTGDACHLGQSADFTLLYDFDVQVDSSLQADGTASMKLEPPTNDPFGSSSAEVSLTCNDCFVSGTADVHVLVRVDQHNPFAESWSWGDVTLDAKIDLDARAQGRKAMDWREDFGRLCLPPMCRELNFGNTVVQAGIMQQLTMLGGVGFSAEAEVTFKRQIRTNGSVGLHTHGSSILWNGAEGFEMLPVDSRDSEPLALQLALDLEAHLELRPNLYVGLFSSVSILDAEAEVYVALKPILKATGNFKYRAARGESSNAIPPMAHCGDGALEGGRRQLDHSRIHDIEGLQGSGTGTSGAGEPLRGPEALAGLLGSGTDTSGAGEPLRGPEALAGLLGSQTADSCNEACSLTHDTRLSTSAEASFTLAYKLYAKASFSVFKFHVDKEGEEQLFSYHKKNALCYYNFPHKPLRSSDISVSSGTHPDTVSWSLDCDGLGSPITGGAPYSAVKWVPSGGDCTLTMSSTIPSWNGAEWSAPSWTDETYSLTSAAQSSSVTFSVAPAPPAPPPPPSPPPAPAPPPCTCPGQYPICGDGTLEGGRCTNNDGNSCGWSWCSSWCGSVGGGSCVSSFTPLTSNADSWRRSHILLTHWNDEAANMLEQLAMKIAYVGDTGAIEAWDCAAMETDSRAACEYFRLSSLPSHIRVVYDSGTNGRAVLLRDSGSDTTVIAFRGTEPTSMENWMTNINIQFKTTNGRSIHAGFSAASAVLQPGILNYLQEHHGPTSTLLITGHSLGAAMATLTAHELRLQGHVTGPIDRSIDRSSVILNYLSTNIYLSTQAQWRWYRLPRPVWVTRTSELTLPRSSRKGHGA